MFQSRKVSIIVSVGAAFLFNQQTNIDIVNISKFSQHNVKIITVSNTHKFF